MDYNHKVLKEIETFLINIGFSTPSKIFNGVYDFRMGKHVIMMEYKKVDTFSDEIKFESFSFEFGTQSDYISLRERLYPSTCLDDLYDECFIKFKNKLMPLLEQKFKSEIRKHKIKKLL